jgi:hypothetical protein
VEKSGKFDLAAARLTPDPDAALATSRTGSVLSLHHFASKRIAFSMSTFINILLFFSYLPVSARFTPPTLPQALRRRPESVSSQLISEAGFARSGRAAGNDARVWRV